MTSQSLQERYGPNGTCFGCGPKNEKGLRIASHLVDGVYRCEWQARPEHEAWPGCVNGGILGALFDCHSNWAAAHHLLVTHGLEELPSTVTAEFHVKLEKPTPSAGPLTLTARVASASKRSATIEAEVYAAGERTGTCRGVFVSVPPGHPGFHRWGA